MIRQYTRGSIVVGAVSLMVFILTVCSAAGTAASANSSGASSSSVRTDAKISKSPIAIGNIGSYSGVLASGDLGGEYGVEAWAKWTNAHGGINGHPIKLYVMDDQANPSTAVTAAKTLVDQDHVVAIVGMISVLDPVWAPIAQQAGVPVVGGLPVENSFVTNPDFYASGGTGPALNYGILKAAKKIGTKLAVLYCLPTEAPSCSQDAQIIKNLAPSTGVTISLSEGVDATSPSFTSYCQAIKQSGAKSYYIIESPSVAVKIANTCLQQGVTAQLIEVSGILTKQFIANPGAANVIGVDANYPATDNTVPAVKTFHAALKKYEPSLLASNSQVEYGQSAMYGWASGELFAAAVNAGGSGTVTTSSVESGLHSLHNQTLGGLAPPLNYASGKANPVNCYFLFKATNGKFGTPYGLKPFCGPSKLINAAAASAT
jgi:branched-chain amino acid transport system substrate-binding protein